MKNDTTSRLEKQERLKKAKNKFQLMRRQVQQNQGQKQRLLALVQEYVRQRPEITATIVKKWIR